ncbi:MAG: hypothetical protein JRG92_18565 [Deltaproteobacteria bacterium]|nr:hypothetical protein [Deltaproteobacteria bacterium]
MPTLTHTGLAAMTLLLLAAAVAFLSRQRSDSNGRPAHYE